MSESQAIPDYLYAYSNNTTPAEETLRTFVNTVLASAIMAYRDGAIDAGYDIGGITLGSPDTTIDHNLRALIGEIHDLDSWVYEVGLAFQACENEKLRQAGNAAPTDYDPNSLVTVDDSNELDAELAKIDGDQQTITTPGSRRSCPRMARTSWRRCLPPIAAASSAASSPRTCSRCSTGSRVARTGACRRFAGRSWKASPTTRRRPRTSSTRSARSRSRIWPTTRPWRPACARTSWRWPWPRCAGPTSRPPRRSTARSAMRC